MALYTDNSIEMNLKIIVILRIMKEDCKDFYRFKVCHRLDIISEPIISGFFVLPCQ